MTALLLAIATFFSDVTHMFTSYLDRPIIMGPIVGLIMGDLQTGCIIGASLELFYAGAIPVGAYCPPDSLVGGVLGTAFAIALSSTSEMALTISLPIALFSQMVVNALLSAVSLVVRLADKYAVEGNGRGVSSVLFICGGLRSLVKALIVYVAFALGSERAMVLLEKIPEVVTQGMTVAGGLLPALGIAMLIKIMMNEKVVPYYFIGYLLAAYFGLPVLGIALFGILLIVIKFDFKTLFAGERKYTAVTEEVDEDDF